MTLPSDATHESGCSGQSDPGAMWAQRALSEREATERFGRLARQLDELKAPAAIRDLAEEAAADEKRHADLCAEMAESYGMVVRQPEGSSDPASDVTASLADRTLFELASLCCICETLNVVVLTKTLELPLLPSVRDATRALLRDEVKHSQLGWAYLKSERDQGRGDFLAEALPTMLSAAVADVAFELHHHVDDEKWLEHGVLSCPMRVALVTETIDKIILDGFERLGVETRAGRAWLEARTASGMG